MAAAGAGADEWLGVFPVEPGTELAGDDVVVVVRYEGSPRSGDVNIITGGGGNLEGVGAVTKGSLDDVIIWEGAGAELVDVSMGFD